MAARKFKPYLAEVVWEDAHHHATQYADPNTLEWEPFFMRTAGYVIKETKEGVILSMDMVPDEDHYRNCTYIPQGMVVKVRRLK